LSDTQWTSATARRFARDREPPAGGRHAVEGRKEGTDETGCGSAAQSSGGTLVFADPASRALLKLLARIAPSDVPIVISGDAGTGKGALARQIHTLSARPGAFVCVNCSAVATQVSDGIPAPRRLPSRASAGSKRATGDLIPR
jgi:transcriptional regulator with AAA-type ATPase domain